MKQNITIIVLSLVMFLLGFYFCMQSPKEAFENKPRCPDMLIQKGDLIYLLNSRLARVPGVNPLIFKNLEEYTEFVKWQRGNNINCPVLYLQHSYNVQGLSEYKIQDNPADLNAAGMPPSQGYAAPRNDLLIDATRNDPPYNKNSYPGYDQDNQYIGLNTPLDKMYHMGEKGGKGSLNPMDPDWIGEQQTEAIVNTKLK